MSNALSPKDVSSNEISYYSIILSRRKDGQTHKNKPMVLNKMEFSF